MIIGWIPGHAELEQTQINSVFNLFIIENYFVIYSDRLPESENKPD